MLPFLGSESCGITVHSVHPHREIVEVGGIGRFVWISAFESELPSLLGLAFLGHILVEVRDIGKQADGITVIQHLPALHTRVVESGNILKAEYFLGRLVIIEIVLSYEDRLVRGIPAIEQKDRESVNGRSDIIRITCRKSCLLRISPADILAIDLHIIEGLVP